MVEDSKGNIIQAMPIDKNSFVGIAAAEPIRGGLVHLGADGDVTAHFTTGDVVLTGLKAGQELAIDREATGVTSTAAVIIT